MSKKQDDPEQVAMDLEAIEDRLAALERARASKDKTEQAVKDARAALRNAMRKDLEAGWNLAYWQRSTDDMTRKRKEQK